MEYSATKNKNRVFITGMGVMSSLGNDVETFWAALINGQSGIRSHPSHEISLPVGWVDFDFSNLLSYTLIRSTDRVSHLTIAAANQAVTSSGLLTENFHPEESGVFWGVGFGGTESIEAEFSDISSLAAHQRKLLVIPAAMTHASAAEIAIKFGITGECQTYSTACSSSSVAIGEGFRRIRDGYLNTAIVGGAEAVITPVMMASWRKMRVLCKAAGERLGSGCRPFSRDRSGFAIGEGAAALVLESETSALARGAALLGEIVGYGVSNDATHITKPNSQGQVMAIQKALKDARLLPKQIGHINAHGTATVIGDAIETQSIKTVFGEHAYHIPISATKSAHGHTIGASGAIELIATLQALQTQIVPPTTHWSERDNDCDLDYVPGTGRTVQGLDFAMSNSFAFGGNNASLVVKRSDPFLN